MIINLSGTAPLEVLVAADILPEELLNESNGNQMVPFIATGFLSTRTNSARREIIELLKIDGSNLATLTPDLRKVDDYTWSQIEEVTNVSGESDDVRNLRDLLSKTENPFVFIDLFN